MISAPPEPETNCGARVTGSRSQAVLMVPRGPAGVRMMRQPDGPTDIARYHSSQTPNAEGRYVGRNFSRYVSAELDTLIDRYLSTIPWPERMQALRAIVRYMSEGATVIGFFYDV